MILKLAEEKLIINKINKILINIIYLDPMRVEILFQELQKISPLQGHGGILLAGLFGLSGPFLMQYSIPQESLVFILYNIIFFKNHHNIQLILFFHNS